MTAHEKPVKAASVAPLKNVSACLALVETLQGRSLDLPGIGVFSGPSGYGKTVAAQYVQNKTGAVYLEVRDFWSRKTFTTCLLQELGVGKPRGTIADMMQQSIEIIGDDPDRPVIIDEADKLVDKAMIELVRDIYETTKAPILLIGEEQLPKKLLEYERVHNRVLDFVLAQPCDIEDVRALVNVVCPDVTVADDLLEEIRAATKGKARRIVTSLHELQTWARNHGTMAVDSAGYSGRIFTGEIPVRHRARPKRTARANGNGQAAGAA